MKIIGKYASFQKDFLTNKEYITFESKDLDQIALQKMIGQDLIIDFDAPKNKRSLDANAYFHVLVGKIAERLTQSKIYVKNQMISEHGQYELVDGEMVSIVLDAEIEGYSVDSMHLQPTDAFHYNSKGKKFRAYLLMRGSHTYNTKEMSKLIDGTVETARELDIEVLTPNQLERMKAEWQRNQY